MKKKIKRTIETDSGIYSERELSQLIRRKMISKEHKNKKGYTRKQKHKGNIQN